MRKFPKHIINMLQTQVATSIWIQAQLNNAEKNVDGTVSAAESYFLGWLAATNKLVEAQLMDHNLYKGFRFVHYVGNVCNYVSVEDVQSNSGNYVEQMIEFIV